MTAAFGIWDGSSGAGAPLRERLSRDRLPEGLAAALCALGAVFLVVDLGKPERMISLFLSPQPTAITVGAYALLLFLVVVVAQMFIRYVAAFSVPRRVDVLLSACGVALAFVIMLYAGLLLSSMPGIDLWASPCVPALFVVSALSAGCALLMGMDALSARSLGCAVRTVSLVDMALLVAEALLLALLLSTTAASGSDGLRAVASMVTGSFFLAFWLGVVGVGLAAAFACEAALAFGRAASPGWKLATAASALVGCFMLRWCIVAGGAYGSIVLPVASL